MKYIIALVVVWIGITILLQVNYSLGSLPTAILMGCLVAWGFHFVSNNKDKEKRFAWIKNKVNFKKKIKIEEEEEEETPWSFLSIIIGTIIFCVAFDYVFGVDIIDAVFKTISELLEGFTN